MHGRARARGRVTGRDSFAVVLDVRGGLLRGPGFCGLWTRAAIRGRLRLGAGLEFITHVRGLQPLAVLSTRRRFAAARELGAFEGGGLLVQSYVHLRMGGHHLKDTDCSNPRRRLGFARPVVGGVRALWSVVVPKLDQTCRLQQT